MRSKWSEYYQKVANHPHRKMTEAAAKLAADLPAVAIDCGCGAGRDTAFLLSKGFKVHAFDKELEAIEFCKERFKSRSNFHASHACFSDFHYPSASLVMAHASLFFCPRHEFEAVWAKLVSSLPSSGVLCIDLMGNKDSWVESPNHKVTSFTHSQVQELLSDFEVVKFNERDEAGKTAIGTSKHWHVYSVLGVKRGT